MTTTHLNPFLRYASCLLGFVLASLGLQAEEGGGAKTEFVVQSDGQPLTVMVQSPPADRLAERPMLLLFFSADRQASMPDGKYGWSGQAFLDQGHRVASFDLPAHGERVGTLGAGIAGFAARIAAGEQPFEQFVRDGRAVIDACLRQGIAEPGRIVVAGVSRGGYCALRLMAADSRITAAAALAPATDWRELDEFSSLKNEPSVAALALEHYAGQLAGRRFYVAIGNDDQRAGTAACTRFVLAVTTAEARAKSGSALRYLVVDDSAGHALARHWREEGIRFLLESPARNAAAPMP